MERLDYHCKVRLLGYHPHLLIANKVVPFDSKKCCQAPLINVTYWLLNCDSILQPYAILYNILLRVISMQKMSIICAV